MKKNELKPGGISDFSTGTTGDAYATILEWSCLGIGKKTIIVANTGVTNTLTLKAFVRAYPNGNDYPEVLYYVDDVAYYERDLLPGEMQRLRFNNAYAELVVQAKSKVASTPTTYRVDHAGAVTG
jgi:hypothetical protein